MRNLKKVLALGLAMVMAFGLMISAAAFTDSSTIKSVDAVNLLTELKIISGFPDGSFKPEGNVTRAQMAKMVYVAMRKGVDDSGTAFVNASVPLTDIASHWAKGYIKYAYGASIIAGFPNGTFQPDANVTGYQAAKMLLTALGYSSTIEGYAGTGWDFRVAVDAASAGLLEDIEGVDLSLPLTRDNAAQMIDNAIFANTVTYDEGVLTEGKTFAEAKLGLLEITGILVANDIATLDTDKAAVPDEGKYIIKADDEFINEPNTPDPDDFYLTIDGNADLALLGQQVTAYVKIKSTANSEALVSKDITKTYGKVIATPGENNVIVDYDDDWTPDDDYTVNSTVLFSVNYGAAWAKNAGLGANEYNVSAGKLSIGTGYTATKGDKKIYIDNDDDDDFDVIIALKMFYGEATVKASAKTIKVPTTGFITSAADFEDVYGVESVKDGDMVLGYKFDASAAYDYCVYPAPSFSGTLTAMSSGGALKISGKNYNLSGIKGSIGEGGATADNIYSNSDNRGTELTYYTDGKYIVDYSGDDSTAVADDYCAIRAVDFNDGLADDLGSFGDPHRVAVTLADGTEKVYDVADADTVFNSQATFEAAYAGQIVPYDVNKGEITLGVAVTDDADSSVGYLAGKTTIRLGTTNYTFTSSSVVFAREVKSFTNLGGTAAFEDGIDRITDCDFDVYAGKANTPDISAVGGAVKDDGKIVALLATGYTASKDDDNWAILMDYTKLYNTDGDVYYELYMYEGGSSLKTYTTDPDDFDVTGEGADTLTSAKQGLPVHYTLTGSKVTELDFQPITVTDDALSITDSTDGYYVGYAYDYDEGDTITLRPSGDGNSSNDYTFDLDSDAYVVDLVEADMDSKLELDVDPVTDDDDIADADAGLFNVIVKVEDGAVVAIFYFSDAEYDTTIA